MLKRLKPQTKRAFLIYAILALLLAASTFLYIYSRTYAKATRLNLVMEPAVFGNIMSRTVPALGGMAVASVLIAVVSLAFQTITESRILTPSMIGFDSVFIGTQTLIVFLFGSMSKVFLNPYLNYLIVAGAMIVISMFMYGFILRKNKNNLVFLLMFGLILSGVIRSGSTYLQVIMDTNDFNQVRAATSVTVNNMNTNIIMLAIPIMICVIAVMLFRHRTYNVMSLGPDNAKSLGINYERELNINLVLISIGMSIATALIGSLAFLGLLAVNISREIFKTYEHMLLFIGSSAVAALALIAGQSIVELLQGAVPAVVIIDLVGCSYMFCLIVKENGV
ncbi:iron-uptake system permease protein FeuC [Oxobacter pfennigii]|uniref:Iron-uptake system permease protein FeuC n=1 Tax=Oxobacter pfennigii TaxID=36849 RepID=A0A0P8WBV6_9CLOT|nr:iron chelate uptake ABC transporter family permease subunit [Oxobacter pfennigii]KPU45202.1 iron-uptake system permease protein FeuC [Oxobacter pfennigii]